MKMMVDKQCLIDSISSCLSIGINFLLSISSKFFEKFSLNFGQKLISMRQCSESLNQLYRLKVRVTVEGHGILH